MRLIEYLGLSAAGIWSNKLRSALTMLGVIIGVAAVVSLVSLGYGARMRVMEELATLAPDQLVVVPGRMTSPMRGPRLTARLTTDDAIAIGDLENVIAGAAIVDLPGEMEVDGEMKEGRLLATEPAALAALDLKVARGRFLREGDEGVIVLGYELAQSLGGDQLGRMVRVGDLDLAVIGVLEKKSRVIGQDFDYQAYMSLDDGCLVYEGAVVGQIAVRATHIDRVSDLVTAIEQLMEQRHEGAGITVIEQKAMLESIGAVLGIMTSVLAGIAGISLLVGGIGIMNIMLATVSERTREIGIRKAVGARDRDIMYQFLMESAALSGLGGLIGLAVGAGGALLAGRVIPQLPVAVSGWALGLTLLFAVVVGLISGTWPALSAARLQPVDALRRE